MGVEAMLENIPYLVPHGLEVRDRRGETEIRMPFRRGLTNYIGTVHAGALFTLAETAAGVAAHRIVPGGRAYILLRGATVRYTRRAEGEVAASARVVAERAEAARADFDREGRASAEVDVTMTDADGETVFEGAFDYALRPRKT